MLNVLFLHTKLYFHVFVILCSYVLVFFCRPVECPSTLNTAWETLLTETQYDAQVRLTVSLI